MEPEHDAATSSQVLIEVNMAKLEGSIARVQTLLNLGGLHPVRLAPLGLLEVARVCMHLTCFGCTRQRQRKKLIPRPQKPPE